MSIDYEYELDENELNEVKRALISHKHHIEFDAKMGFNYHVSEEYDYVTEIIAKIDKMIKRQKDMLADAAINQDRKSSYYNEDEEILSDGDIPF